MFIQKTGRRKKILISSRKPWYDWKKKLKKKTTEGVPPVVYAAQNQLK